MDTTTSGVLNNVTQRTNSELILFFIIIAVVVLALAVPLYRFNLANAREKRKMGQERADQERAERAQLIGVIQNNTDVNTQLKVLLETNNNVCAQCRMEHQDIMNELADKIDLHNDKLVEVHTVLKTRPCLNTGGIRT